MNYVLIVAGGSGKRMKSAIPKQFLEIDAKPILYYTTQKFIDVFPSYKIVVVLPDDTFSSSDFLGTYFPNQKNIITVAGGETRFHSVQNGLNAIEDNSGIVLIHDAVRPFVSTEVLQRCIETATTKGNAIPCIALKDSLRHIENETNHAIDRSNYVSVQTPQTFSIREIKKAYSQAYQTSFTDEASVYEAMGGQIHLVEGNEENIKITTMQDLVLAEYLVRNEKEK